MFMCYVYLTNKAILGSLEKKIVVYLLGNYIWLGGLHTHHVVIGGRSVPGGDDPNAGNGVHRQVGQSIGQLSNLWHGGRILEKKKSGEAETGQNANLEIGCIPRNCLNQS